MAGTAPFPHKLPLHLGPGDPVGQYEILAVLGKGGMGRVFKVRRGEGTYALKMFAEAYVDDADVSETANEREWLRRAGREFFALQALVHPNVLRAYAFDRWPEPTRGWPYIVTEFVDGSEISSWRSRERPTLRRLCEVLAKVADALAHIHDAGLIHRDLTARNILVRREGGEPVVIDLGVARHGALEPVTTCTSVGTPTHYAPEYAEYLLSDAVARGEAFEWTPAVDVYSLGAVAYELLTGKSPVAAPGNEREVGLVAIRSRAAEGVREVNEDVPEKLAELVMALLVKDPEARPAADAAAAGLRKAAMGGGPEMEARLATRSAASAQPPPWQEPVFAPDEPTSSADTVYAVEDADDDLPPPIDVGGDAVEASPAEPGDEDRAAKPDELPDELKLVKARLESSRIRRPSSRVLIGIGGGVACALVALMALTGSRATPAPDDLLSGLEAQARLRKESSKSASPASATRQAPSGPAAPSVAPPSPSDAKDIDAAIAARYGRPTVPPGGGPVSMPASAERREAGAGEPRKILPEDEDPFIHVVAASPGVNDSPEGQQRKLGVSMGTRIRARLASNLDSRTMGAGPVEAMLPIPVVLRGEVVLPARTMLYGRASEAGGRFSIQFTRAKLPDDTELAIEGLAMDRGDGKPGLAPGARIAPTENDQGDGLGTKIARGTGNVLLGAVTGGLVEDALRGAGSTVVNDRSAGPGGSGFAGGAILLEPGVLFDVFVTKSM